MEDPSTTPKVVSADRLDGGVIITFDDGKCAVYPDSFLYNSLHHATEVLEEKDWL